MGTLLDGHGNDFDQSALLVALLRESGYTAGYVSGTIQLTAAQIGNWLGVDTSTACPYLYLLNHGGLAVPVSGCDGPFSVGNIPHVWVTATGGSLGTTTYVFDPSFKTYSAPTAGINLATVMNYCRTGTPSCFLPQAEAGATITSDSIQNVNSTNMHSALTGYANNLVSYIKSNMPTATLKDVIGGKYIQPLTQPYTPLTSLPYEMPGDTPTTWAGDIPDMYRTTMEVIIGGIDVAYYADQVYGHRLSIVYNSSLQPVLYLDGVLQGIGTASANTISYNIDFPFCFATTGSASAGCGSSGGVNYTNIFSFQNVVQAGNGYTYAIVNGWDYTARGMLDFHRQQLQANLSAGGAPNSEAVLGETLNMIGYAWLTQLSAANDVTDHIVGSKVVTLCAVGVVGQVTGPYIDMPGGFVGTSSLTSDKNRANTAFFTDGGNLSAFEWGTLDQNLSKENIGAVSTIKLLDITNTQGLVIYDATSSNWSTISGLLTNYNGSDLAEIGGYISNGYRVILPQKGNLTQNGWTGVGYLGIATSAVGTETITYKISSNLKGGYPDGSTDPAAFVPLVENTTPPLPPPTQIASAEPIDLSTGAYLYDHDDITIGSGKFPYSLTLHSSYSSNNRYSTGSLGLGWSHNFAINAIANSDGLKGLGQDSPIDGAAAIAAVYVAQDLLSDATKPLTNLVIASLSQRWFMDHLINNTVNVTSGSQNEQFVKLADGSYNPQLGSTDRLSLSGGTYTLQDKSGTTFTFNTNGNISAWQIPAGVNVTFAYDSASPPKLTSISNNLGRSLTLSYNGSGQISSVGDNSGRTISYGYDSSSNLTSSTDPIGNISIFSYVSPGLLAQIFYPSLPSSPFVTTAYDSLGRVASQSNANSATWNYFFAGYRSEEDDPFGTRHVLYYNPRGKAQFDIQDLSGLDRTTSFAYDGLDRLLSQTMPEGNNSAYTYAANNPWANNVSSIARNPKPGSPLAPLTTTYTYDPVWNKPTSITDALGLVTAMSYDAIGNLTTSTTDAGASPHFNARQTFTYNSAGQILTATDRLGTITQYSYDSFGNPTSVIRDCCGGGHLNQTTTLAYSAFGDLISVTDPNNNVSTNTYDADRRRTTTTSPGTAAAPGGLVTTFTYDPIGQLLQTSQSAGGSVLRQTSTAYTPTGKPSTTRDGNGNPTQYTYDANDRLASATDARGRKLSYAYDTLNRQISVSNLAIQGSPVLQQAYTPNGLIASLTNANGFATSFTPDGFDRLSTMTYPDSSTQVLSYDADSNVLSRQTRAGATISFTYDTLNRLSTKAASSEPTVTYSYDLAGHPVGIVDNSASMVPPSVGTIATLTSTYDGLNNLTGSTWGPAAAQTAPSASSATFTHVYDATNRRISQTATDNSYWSYPAATASTVSYTANKLDQYAAVGSVTPTYDGNGNLTFDGTFTYGYDAENRLISASGAGDTAAYAYDAQGRRKSKTVNGTTTIFVQDPQGRALLDYDGASGAIQNWYACGSGPNDVLNQINVTGSTRATYIPDIQGSIVASLDASSGTLTKAGYQSFGESTVTSGTFRYTGARIDAETNGLYDFRARMYSPTLGRFMQTDPTGAAGGINLYAYVNNDPLNLTDPLGLCNNPQGCGSSGGLLGFLAPAGTAVEIAAEGAAVGLGTVVAGVVAGAAALLYPSSTQSQQADSDPGVVFYHGTSAASGLALLNGAPLSAQAAAANNIDGPIGFYLATDPAAAEFFAARRAPGTILQYDMTGAAFRSLTGGGSTFGPIPQGNFPTPFPGLQLMVPPTQFSQFDVLRGGGAITVSPYRPQ